MPGEEDGPAGDPPGNDGGASQNEACEQLQAPEKLNCTTETLKKVWKTWREEVSLYMELAHGNKTQAYQVRMLKYLLGVTGRDIYKTLQFDKPESELTLNEVLEAFDKRVDPKKNEIVERYKFFTREQAVNEGIEAYHTELRMLAQTCNFGELTSSLIRDRIVCGIRSSTVRERLLRQENLTLEKCIQDIKANEMSKEQMTAIENSKTASASVDNVTSHASRTPNRRKQPKQSTRKETKYNDSNTHTYDCKKCGRRHGPRACPAYGKTCDSCGKPGHFRKMCKPSSSKHRKNKPRAKVDDVQCQSSSEEDDEEYYIGSVEDDDDEIEKDEWKETVNVNNKYIVFKLDTGADVNCLPSRDYSQLKPKPRLHKTKAKLKSYGGGKIPVKGKCLIEARVHDDKKEKVLVYVVDSKLMPSTQPILGKKACERLNLVRRVLEIDRMKQPNEPPDASYDFVRREYSEVFGGIGCLPGTHKIVIDPECPPVQNACRKVPFPLREKLKNELDRMQKLGVIIPEESPTDWVSSVVTVKKKSGDLRVCLDPRDLNRAIKREHYKLPSREEILARLSGAKVFSKLDAASGFWQLQLDDESSKLTTFITPFGRYRYLRLPFGISSAPEAYHRTISRLFETIEGVETMMDDIIIWGSTKEEHDARLRKVLDTVKEANLKLKKEKCQFGVSQLTFIGDLLTDNGVKPDPCKVSAIENMEKPSCKADLQRFLGMITYQAKFIPDLSTKTTPLRELLNKTNEWSWGEQQESAWQELKSILTTEPVLQFYHPDRKTKISADASKSGLGAVILQKDDDHDEWYPVAYASRAMTPAEVRYAQIEKECLALTFACQRFHQFIYGQTFQAETDHKPLVAIFRKPLAECPLRLQCMRIKLQRYDFKLEYTPGKYLYTADTLSRAVDPTVKASSQMEDDIEAYVNMVTTTVPVAPTRIEQIRAETLKDPDLQELIKVIAEGWPEQCTAKNREYWNVRAELTVVDGIVYKGQKIVIPRSMRKIMLEKIHEGHLGMEKCKQRARSVMYWPRMNSDIDNTVKDCYTCLQYRPKHQAEPLNPHPVPDGPWQKVGVDLFELNSHYFVIIADYYSGYPEVVQLSSITSTAVINAMKGVFGRHGVPFEVFSDNGPQFAGEEFQQFAETWEFKHSTSSPTFPKSNGLAERTVQTVKNLIKKSKASKQDACMALLVYRSTPLNCGKSPAELLMNRQLRSNLPMKPSLLTAKAVKPKFVKQRRDKEKQDQKYHHDKRARKLPELKVGDPVCLQHPRDNTWSKEGVIYKKLKHRSYLVKLTSGSFLRRNRAHIRKSCKPPATEQIAQYDNTETAPHVNNQHVQKHNQQAAQNQ